ncbi:MAG: dual specificity protein phosphatase family protein [Emcibacter sp.]|nr:dual specificity protein phosphatase family protein [Emcibacter sp.]
MLKKILFPLISCLTIILAIISPVSADAHGKKHIIDLRAESPVGNMSNIISLHGSIYMAGQPDPVTLGLLGDQGFEVVINIRREGEVDFDERTLVGNNLSYYNIPLLKDGKIQDAAVEKIHAALSENKGKKILLHCSSGNRVAAWFGAHLVRDMGYAPDKAIALAKEAGMTKAGMAKILRGYLDELVKK